MHPSFPGVQVSVHVVNNLLLDGNVIGSDQRLTMRLDLSREFPPLQGLGSPDFSSELKTLACSGRRQTKQTDRTISARSCCLKWGNHVSTCKM
jgi:hypothetical protein